MAKIKARITGIDQVTERFQAFLKNAIKDESTLKTIAAESVDQIKKRTRGRQTDYFQAPLEDSTIARRITLIKQGNGSEFADPKISNLTLSGQLLNAIRFEIESAKSLIKFSLSDKRRPYKGAKGQDLETKTNNEIRKDLESRGFPFFYLSEKLKARLQSKLKAEVRRQLQNYKKIKRSLK